MAENRRGGSSGTRARPEPISWRPVISVSALIFGLLFGLGSAVLLQQYSVRVLTRAALIQTVLATLIVSIVLPSIVRAFTVRKYNRILRKAGLA